MNTIPTRGAKAVPHKQRVILTQEIKKLGERGQEISVTAGFARNYLLLKKLAVPVSLTNRKAFPAVSIEEMTPAEQNKVRRGSSPFNKNILRMFRHANKKKGSNPINPVTREDISEKVLRQFRIELAPEDILLEEAILVPGSHVVPILYRGHPDNLKLSLKKI
ncbi:50S ribosomal protein L9 [Planoprotostelium fungivorum]|uniref:50S ribosomal protein L9 n=1 Tax=Planoprotostelium fungivorum TaxID=1890364 RepID=A0A2P6NJN8_9EUKA|nr:50S ribosomal protein L9 [Planoprotostelium fungivorum]